MIDFNKNYVKENIIEYRFMRNGLETFTFKDFIGISKDRDDSHNFSVAMDRALKDSRKVFEAYYWECPPICQGTVGDQFKFVTVKAPSLSKVKQNPLPFQEKFRGNRNKAVCSFENLGGDATLVAPVPKNDLDFTHLANFNENADSNTKRALWENVAEELKTALKDNQPKWLSTNGMGVHYLHVRIDKYPKYYEYDNYRIPPADRSMPYETSQTSRSHSLDGTKVAEHKKRDLN